MTGRTRERGQLEAAVMRILWDSDEPLGAGQIQEAFQGDPVPAYTTVLTVLDRLQKKGQVTRLETSPRKVRFRAARTAGEHGGQAMLSALDEAGDREAALLQFAGNLTAQDVAMLERALRPRKGEGGTEG